MNKEKHVILSPSNPFEPKIIYSMDIMVGTKDVKKPVRFIAFGKPSLTLIDEDAAKRRSIIIKENWIKSPYSTQISSEEH